MRFLIIIATLMMMATLAFAQSMGVPDANPLQKLGELVLNWENLSSLMKGSLAVLILVQVIKQVTDFKYKRLLVTLLSIGYGVLQMLIGDANLSQAIIAVLISGGGASALYEVLKPFLRSIPLFDFLKLGDK